MSGHTQRHACTRRGTYMGPHTHGDTYVRRPHVTAHTCAGVCAMGHKALTPSTNGVHGGGGCKMPPPHVGHTCMQLINAVH